MGSTNKPNNKDEPPTRDTRLSMEGVDPEEALRALLSVDPGSDPVEPVNDENSAGEPSPAGLPADEGEDQDP